MSVQPTTRATVRRRARRGAAIAAAGLLVGLFASSTGPVSVSAAPAPDPSEYPACTTIGTVAAGEIEYCTVAAGETVEFTVVGAHGGDGGYGGAGGNGGDGYSDPGAGDPCMFDPFACYQPPPSAASAR